MANYIFRVLIASRLSGYFPVESFFSKNTVEDYVDAAVKQVIQLHLGATEGFNLQVDLFILAYVYYFLKTFILNLIK